MSGEADRPAQRFGLRACGLDLESDRPVTGFSPLSDGAPLLRPETRLRWLCPARMDELWATGAREVLEPLPGVRDERFSVDRTEDHYRFWLQDFGRYAIAADGSAICCELGGTDPDRQERFLFAHALPVAAVLRGYEVLHAGAVVAGGGAAAFVAPAGVGKTRLTATLVARGARFVTDDVLAIERGRDPDESAASTAVVAHTGPPFMAIRPEDRDVLGAVGGGPGSEVGATDKLHVAPPAEPAALELDALYHLERGRRFAIERAEVDPHQILSLNFIPYLMTPERLRRHLELAQLIGAEVAHFRLTVPAPRRATGWGDSRPISER